MADAMRQRPPAPAPLDLVEAFVNTLDLEDGSDELATTSDLRLWLSNRRLIRRSQSVTERDLERAIRLREALRQGVLANNRKEAVSGRRMQELNGLARDVCLVVTFDGDGSVRLDPSANGAAAGLARILAAVFVSMVTGRWVRLKGCANDACQWTFYDASKNRSSRWCQMADCGNDAKGRAYRARRRSGGSARSRSR